MKPIMITIEETYDAVCQIEGVFYMQARSEDSALCKLLAKRDIFQTHKPETLAEFEIAV